MDFSRRLIVLFFVASQTGGYTQNLLDRVGTNLVWMAKERQANSTVWESVAYATNAITGRARPLTNSYIELAGGLNVLNSRGQYESANSSFTLTENGAEALGTTHRLVLAPDIARDGAVHVRTSEGIDVVSHPLGLNYFDPVTGNSVILGSIRRSQGWLISSNVVVYSNCFVGISASLLYRNTLAGMVQDLLLHEAISPPEDYGLSSESRLELFTELVGDTPEPEKTERVLRQELDPHKRANWAEPDLTDATLKFSTMKIGQGFAFMSSGNASAAWNPAGELVPVAKQYRIEGGKRILIEAIEYRRVQNLITNLPPRRVQDPRSGSIKAGERTLPIKQLAGTPPAAIRVAQAGGSRDELLAQHTPPVFVWDYFATLSATYDLLDLTNNTYHVTGWVEMNHLKIRGGAVLKFDDWQSPNSPALSVQQSIECRTTPHHIAVFTGKDDDSVGFPLPGSSGNPAPNRYGLPMLFFDGPASTELKHIRFSYASIAIVYYNTGYENTLRHCQMVNGWLNIYASGSAFKLKNVLVTGVDSVIEGDSLAIEFENLTAHSVASLAIDYFQPSSTLDIKRSLMVNVAGNGMASGTTTMDAASGLWTTEQPIFTAAGLGAYYLAGSTYRNTAAANSIADAAFRKELEEMTTMPPQPAPSLITVDTELSADAANVARPDNDGFIDSGYHYPLMTHYTQGTVVQSGTLKLNPGVVLGAKHASESFGLKVTGGKLVADGAPRAPVRLLPCNMIQEQLGSTPPIYTYALLTDGPFGSVLSTTHLRFAHLSVLGDEAYHFKGGHYLGRLALTDCEIRGGRVGGYYYGLAGRALAWTNSLFERVKIDVTGGQPMNLHLYNNLFFQGSFLVNPGGSSWQVHDNVFDHVAVIPPALAFTKSHNGFVGYGGASPFGTVASDQFATALAYQTGPLGDYYLPELVSGQANPLLNEGHRSSLDAGLFNYTSTGTGRDKDDVDIGYHHVYYAAPTVTIDPVSSPVMVDQSVLLNGEVIPHVRGRILAAQDEWIWNESIFVHSDAAQFAANVAGWFSPSGSGAFLARSRVPELINSDLEIAIQAANHSFTVNDLSFTDSPFSLENFLQYDGILVGGDLNRALGAQTTLGLTMAPTLIDYVNAGGSVYVAAGTFKEAYERAGSAALLWNPFLSTFGLSFAPTYSMFYNANQLPPTTEPNTTIQSPHRIFRDATRLFQVGGNPVHKLEGSGQDTRILEFQGTEGLFGIFNGASAQWTGPAQALFSDPESPITSVRFSSPGVYVLRLTGSELGESAYAEIQITVTSPLHLPPVVDAGEYPMFVTPSSGLLQVPLVGTVTHYSIQDPSVTWTVASAPEGAAAEITDPGSLSTTVAFDRPGIYHLRLSATDSEFTVSDLATITVVENLAPRVDVGPDRTVAPTTQLELAGSATDDGVPAGPLVAVWSCLSHPSLQLTPDPSDPLKASVGLIQPGEYRFELSVADGLGATGTDEIVVLVGSPWSRTYTRNADFAEGMLLNVNFTGLPDALQINQRVTPFPFINFALSVDGSVVRLDANNGQILGTYRTAPQTVQTPDPSRTTVDRFGNLWVANRGENSVTRIGLVLGGTPHIKVGENEFIPDPAGTYLKGPFLYNTCTDRDGDTYIQTSRGAKLPWPNPHPGVDTDGARIESGVYWSGAETADDECILSYTKTALYGTRTIAIDANNNAWVGSGFPSLDTRVHQHIDGKTGLVLDEVWNDGCGAYGGVVDRNNTLWSASTGLYKLDLDSLQHECVNLESYGLTLDPTSGHLWFTHVPNLQNQYLIRFDGISYQPYELPPDFHAKGLAIDQKGNIWVARGAQGVGNAVDHLFVSPSGVITIGKVELPCAEHPTGVAIDHRGKVWVSNADSHNVMRIDPDKGPIGPQGVPVGEVDLVVNFPGGGPYNYSDMTGYVVLGGTVPSGSWTVTHTNQPGESTWHSLEWECHEADGARVVVEARAADAYEELAAVPFEELQTDDSAQGPHVLRKVADAEELAGLLGHHLEVRVTLFAGPTGVSPILYDLTVHPIEGGVVSSEMNQTLAVDDEFTLYRNQSGARLDVLRNDLIDQGWRITRTSPPAYGVVEPTENGSALEYVPNAGFSGTDSFTYTIANDLGGVSSARVILKVAPSPAPADPVIPSEQPIIARDDHYHITYAPGDSSLPLAVTRNDFHPESLPLTIRSFTQPAIGSVSLSFQCGVFDYAPANFGNYRDTFHYTVTDGAGKAAGATVVIDVESINGARLASTLLHVKGQPKELPFKESIWIDFGAVNQWEPQTIQIRLANDGNGSLSVGQPVVPQGVTLDLTSWPRILEQSQTVEPTFSYDAANLGAQSKTITIPVELNSEVSELAIHLRAHVNASPPAFSSVVIVHPGPHRAFLVGTNIDVIAVPLEENHGIDHVTFILLSESSRTVIGSDDSPPYTATVQISEPGHYSLLAIAYDSPNEETASAKASPEVPIRVLADQNRPPNARDDQAYVAQGSTVRIQVLGNDDDPDGDALSVHEFTQPQFGLVEREGDEFIYSPVPGVVGDYFSYVVTDRQGGYDRAYVNIHVQDSTLSVVLTASDPSSGGFQLPMSHIDLVASVTPADNVSRVDFYANGRQIGFDTQAPFEMDWKILSRGAHSVVAVARDIIGNRTGSNPVELELISSENVSLPTAHIGQLTETGHVRTGRLEVPGKAFGGSVSWELTVRNLQGEVMTGLSGTGAIGDAETDDIFGTLDLTMLRNDAYELELRVSNGSDWASDHARFLLDTDLKLGQFTFSQVDLTVPFHNISLSVVRTYDSLNSSGGDFGPGWTYSLVDLEPTLDEERGGAVDLDDESVDLRAGGGRNVTLTLPDGRRTTFAFSLVEGQSGDPGVPCFCYNAIWTPPPGISATLGTTVSSKLITLPSGLVYWEAAGLDTPFEQFEFPGFILTNRDQTEYVMERRQTGNHFILTPDGQGSFVQTYGPPKLTEIRTPTGDLIKVTDNGLELTRPDGKVARALRFTRNTLGYITEIHVLSSGAAEEGVPLVKYEYSARGQLRRVLKALSHDPNDQRWEVSEFVYGLSAFPHYITEIVDPRGVSVAKSYYDPQGRLDRVEGPDGRNTEFVYDEAPEQGDVRVRTVEKFGEVELASTFHESDGRGNVVLTVDPLQTTTIRSFDENNLMISEVVSGTGGNLRMAYDPHYFSEAPSAIQRLLTKRGPEGAELKSIQEFDERGRLLRIVDELNTNIDEASASPHPAFATTFEYEDTTTDALTANQATWPASPTDNFLITQNFYFQDGPFKGLLEKSVDAAGRWMVYEYYDGEETGGQFGDLKVATDELAGGTKLSRTVYKYDSHGNRTHEIRQRIVNSEGVDYAVTEFKHDAQGRVVETIDPLGGHSYTTYDASGRVLSRVDRYGATTQYTYDASGRLIQTRYPDLATSRTVEYYAHVPELASESLKHIVVETPHLPGEPVRGRRTIHDPLGRPIRAEHLKDVVIRIIPDQASVKSVFESATVISTTRTKYDFAGRVEMTMDPNGKWTKHYFDDYGRRWKTQAFVQEDGDETPDTTTTLHGYDSRGNQVWVLAPNEYTYLQQADPNVLQGDASQVHQNLYDNVDKRQWLTHFQYDEFNRQTKVHLPAAYDIVSISQSTYDNAGRRWLQIDADGKATAFIHDVLGRLEWVVTDVHLAASLEEPLPSTAAGWREWARGTRPEWDSTATQYEYDELGRLEVQRDARGRATTFEYDELDRRTRRQLPQTNFEIWTYDYGSTPGSGTKLNRLRHQDFARRFILSEFDAMGRLTDRRPDGQEQGVDELPEEARRGVTYSYTGAGQRQTMLEGPYNQRLTRYVYDERQRLRIKEAPEGTLTYDYDEAGNVTRVHTCNMYSLPASGPFVFESIVPSSILCNPDGASMAYQYDGRNRLWKVNPEGLEPEDSAAATYVYDPSGNLKTVHYGNGVTTTYDYNVRNQLRWARSVNAQGAPLASFDYDDADPGDSLTWPSERKLAPSGQRRGVRETIPGQAGYPRLVGYDFDALNRLTQEGVYVASSQTWSPTPAQQLVYDSAPGYSDLGYDEVGNRHRRTSNLAGAPERLYAAYDANDQLGNSGSGMVKAWYDINGNTLRTDKNADGNPDTAADDQYDFENRLITRPAGSAIGIAYDGDGNRVSKTVGSTTTFYVFDDRNPTGYAQVLEERSSLSGSPTVSYVYGLDLVSQNRSGVVHYYGYDGHGSTRYLTTSSGAVASSYTYDAFGILLAQLPASNPPLNVYRFAGEQWDSDLGLYYNRARYYDPDLGRFWTMDSFEGVQTDPLSLHKYLYAHADPINRIDPSGHFGIFKFTREFGNAAHSLIESHYQAEHPAAIVGPTTGVLGTPLKPDILNPIKRTYGEIKPLSLSGVTAGVAQMVAYGFVFGPGGAGYSHEDWPGPGVVRGGYVMTIPIAYFNVEGLIFYTDVVGNTEELATLATIELVRQFIRKGLVQRTVTQALRPIPGLVTARAGADQARLQMHVGIASLLASLGAF